MNKDSTSIASLGLTSDPPLEAAGPTSRVQWGAILAGSLAGFAVTIIMMTLGLAIGATTGAAKADEAVDPGEAATVAGVGLAVWSLLTAIAAGFVGGAVLNRMARYDRPYMPIAFGTLTWTGGVVLGLLVAGAGAPGMMAAAGGAAGGAAPQLQGPGQDRSIPRAERPATDERAVGVQETNPQDEVRKREAVQKAATGTAAAAWVLLGAQLAGLAATMLAARWRKAREIPVKHGAHLG